MDSEVGSGDGVGPSGAELYRYHELITLLKYYYIVN